VFLAETFLNWAHSIERARETFDGGHRSIFCLYRKYRAALHCGAVEEDGASSAIRRVATNVGASETRVFADEVHEKCPVFDIVALRPAIDLHLNAFHARVPFCIAFQTFSGVTGMSMCSTPNGASALMTALTTAGGLPTAPDSPMPFAPRGLFGHKVVMRPAV
jgi:hypothetical protein